MKEEIAKVIRLMEEGQIDSDKATDLISLLKEKEEKTSSKRTTSYLDKTLKIRISSVDNDNVNVNLPLKLVRVVLRAGHGIAINVPEAEKYIKDLDIDMIIEAIDQEIEGQIVDIKSGDGDTVAIFVE